MDHDFFQNYYRWTKQSNISPDAALSIAILWRTQYGYLLCSSSSIALLSKRYAKFIVIFRKRDTIALRFNRFFNSRNQSPWLSHWKAFQIIMYSGELIWHVYMCVRLAQKIHGCQVRKFNHSLLLLLIVTQLQYLSDWWYRKRNTTVHMVCWEWSMRSGFLTIVDLE